MVSILLPNGPDAIQVSTHRQHVSDEGDFNPGSRNLKPTSTCHLPSTFIGPKVVFNWKWINQTKGKDYFMRLKEQFLSLLLKLKQGSIYSYHQQPFCLSKKADLGWSEPRGEAERTQCLMTSVSSLCLLDFCSHDITHLLTSQSAVNQGLQWLASKSCITPGPLLK